MKSVQNALNRRKNGEKGFTLVWSCSSWSSSSVSWLLWLCRST